MDSDTTFTKADGPIINIINPAAGVGTNGMVVTGTAPFPSGVVTNLGPDDTIDMTNSDIPYTPALALTDPLVAPWDGGASFRDFYLP
jgi:hypothetical protein